MNEMDIERIREMATPRPGRYSGRKRINLETDPTICVMCKEPKSKCWDDGTNSADDREPGDKRQ